MAKVFGCVKSVYPKGAFDGGLAKAIKRRSCWPPMNCSCCYGTATRVRHRSARCGKKLQVSHFSRDTRKAIVYNTLSIHKESAMRYCGRDFTEEELAWIRRIIADRPETQSERPFSSLLPNGKLVEA